MSTMKLTRDQRDTIWRSVSNTLAESVQARKRHLERLCATIIENHILKEARDFAVRNSAYLYQYLPGGGGQAKRFDVNLNSVLLGGTNYFALTNSLVEEAMMKNEAVWRLTAKTYASADIGMGSVCDYNYFRNFEKELEYKNVRQRYHSYLLMATRVFAQLSRYVGPLELHCTLSRREYEYINTYGMKFGKEVYEWASRNYFKNSFALEFIDKLREYVDEIFKVVVQLVVLRVLVFSKCSTGEELQAYVPGIAGLLNKLRSKGDVPKEPLYQIAPLEALEVSAKLKNLFKA